MTRLLLAAALLLAPLSGADGQVTPERRIEAARQRAASAGIPVALLDGKVAEGRAKGVPADRIAAAVERRLASLERARDVMGGGARPPALTADDLGVGADALDAGVDPAALGRLAHEAAADRRTVAIAVLTQLVQEGMASAQALARVTAALARGPDELRRLPGEAHGRGPGEGQGQGHGQGGPPASVPGAGKGNPRGQGHGRKP
jgi:hypothetical protein